METLTKWQKRNTAEYRAKKSARDKANYAEKKAAGLIVPQKRGRKKGFKMIKPLIEKEKYSFVPKPILFPVKNKNLRLENLHQKPKVKKHSFSKEELKIIKDHAYNYSDEYIASILKFRTYQEVRTIRTKLKLKKPKYFVTVVRAAEKEVKQMRKLFTVLQDMKALIIMAELTTNNYKKDKIKDELFILSNLSIHKSWK